MSAQITRMKSVEAVTKSKSYSAITVVKPESVMASIEKYEAAKPESSHTKLQPMFIRSPAPSPPCSEEKKKQHAQT